MLTQNISTRSRIQYLSIELLEIKIEKERAYQNGSYELFRLHQQEYRNIEALLNRLNSELN